MKMEVDIRDNTGGKKRGDFVQAVGEFTQALADRNCQEFRWKLHNDTYTVSFDTDDMNLTQKELKEAVQEFNDGGWDMVCTIHDGWTYELPATGTPARTGWFARAMWYIFGTR